MENARNTAIDPGRNTMKAKKGKGKAARKRAVKDLPPRKGADAKGWGQGQRRDR
jgi:hypothetical protein